MTEWQPIETAPAGDGRQMLVYPDRLGRVTVGARSFRYWEDAMVPADHMGREYIKPTHWMPLPAPPEA